MLQISMHTGANCSVSDLTKIEELERAPSCATVSFPASTKSPVIFPRLLWFWMTNKQEPAGKSLKLFSHNPTRTNYWHISIFVIKEKSHWFECAGWRASTLTTWGRRWRNLEIAKKVQKRQLHQCNHTLHDLAGMKTSSFNFCLKLAGKLARGIIRQW